MINKKLDFDEYVFMSEINTFEQGYKFDAIHKVTIKVPTTFKDCNDDIEAVEGKKPLLRFEKIKDEENDRYRENKAYVDIYLEDYKTGNIGFILRSQYSDKSTKLHLEDVWGFRKNKYIHKFGRDFNYLMLTILFKVYIADLFMTNLDELKLVYCVYDPDHIITRKELKTMMQYTTEIIEEIDEDYSKEKAIFDTGKISFKVEKEKEIKE